MKKVLSLLLALTMALALAACGGDSGETADPGDDAAGTADAADTAAEPVELYVFAAASMEESLPRPRRSRWCPPMTPPAP